MASKNLSAEGIEEIVFMTRGFRDQIIECFWDYVKEDVEPLYEGEEEALRMACEEAGMHESPVKDSDGNYLSWDELTDIYY